MSAAAVSRPVAHVYDQAYASAPNWDIGRPQRAFVAMVEAGLVREPVLDVGCGTGELSLFLARQGVDVLGIDLSPLAIRQAREKAYWRDIDAHFQVWDALELEELGSHGFGFRTVVDSGMFHLLGDRERNRYLEGVDAVVEPSGLYGVLGDDSQVGGRYYGFTPDEVRRRFAAIGDWEIVLAVESAYERRWGANPGHFVIAQKR